MHVVHSTLSPSSTHTSKPRHPCCASTAANLNLSATAPSIFCKAPNRVLLRNISLLLPPLLILLLLPHRNEALDHDRRNHHDFHHEFLHHHSILYVHTVVSAVNRYVSRRSLALSTFQLFDHLCRRGATLSRGLVIR